jgi:cell division protein FtsI/penicillin-binding protein 2
MRIIFYGILVAGIWSAFYFLYLMIVEHEEKKEQQKHTDEIKQ